MTQDESQRVENIGPLKNFDDLLSKPTVADLANPEDFEPELQRQSCKYKNTSERFFIKKRNFESQYAPLYSARLQQMKPWALQRANELWNKDGKLPVLEKLLGSTEGVKCIIVGTLYKEMPLVPRVLNEFTKERGISAVTKRDSYVSNEDTLILEDETGRTTLVGSGTFQIKVVTTGMVVAVKGTALKGGEFEVEEICHPGIPPQVPFKGLSDPAKYVALISGTRVGDANQNPLALQLFVDYVCAHLGSSEEQKFAANIVRVVFAGNSLCSPEDAPESATLLSSSNKFNKKMQRNLVAPLKELDATLTQLACSVNVDLMPGESDPANYTLPQQPFARCLFPMATRYPSFQSVTNPYEAKIDGRGFLGTSGQSLDNLERYMVIEDKLSLLEQTLHWRHLAPTVPDQLAAYPFELGDPFVIGECPHVYFVGNQKAFKTKLVEGPKGQKVRLILVPSFADTPTVVLVNLNDLNVHPITFDTNFL